MKLLTIPDLHSLNARNQLTKPHIHISDLSDNAWCVRFKAKYGRGLYGIKTKKHVSGDIEEKVCRSFDTIKFVMACINPEINYP